MTIFTSAARTVTANSVEFTLPQGKLGGVFFLNITASSGTTPTLDVKFQVLDPVSGVWHDITGAAFSQKTSTGADSLTIYPGIAAAANDTVSYPLGGAVRAVATIAGTTPSFTFSLSGELI
jgi:hypothetical protein